MNEPPTPGTPQSPPAETPPEAAAAPTKKGSKKLLLGALAGAVVAFGALLLCGVGATVAYWKLGREKALPIDDVSFLPAKTKAMSGRAISVSTATWFSVPEMEVPEELMWARMATIACGEHDFRWKDVKFAVLSAKANTKLDDVTTKRLTCGRDFYRILEGKKLYNITFHGRGDDDSKNLSIFWTRGDAPGRAAFGFDEFKGFGIEDGRCLESSGGCGGPVDTALGKAVPGEGVELWGRGFTSELPALGRNYIVTRSEWKAARLRKYEEGLGWVAGASSWTVTEKKATRLEYAGSKLTFEVKQLEERSGTSALAAALGESFASVPGDAIPSPRSTLAGAEAYKAAWKAAAEAAKPEVGKSGTRFVVKPDASKTKPFIDAVNARVKAVAAKIRAAVGE